MGRDTKDWLTKPYSGALASTVTGGKYQQEYFIQHWNSQ
jgi:hypothetical protein